ncbi:MAG: hypothetical protein AAGM22_25985 [Acidobacteriota bacterium]
MTGNLATYRNPSGTFASRGDTFALPDDDSTGTRVLIDPWPSPAPKSDGELCVSTSEAICLGDRFRLSVEWRDFEDRRGVGVGSRMTDDTAAFWFFDPQYVELLVKVLDGTGFNGHRWVFYGALSNVEYTLTVEDVLTGEVRRYFNPACIETPSTLSVIRARA